ncbi:MAG: outer membrane protein assembly factor BamE [Gammaproteobacteria bacterium]|nr:outer membrane protein assembly factor BamE [Gammaproteobacteria bacterium]MDH3767360.1 outer membrane protein assembly factor BamE [Gammaproteobacteria bacterium]
MKNLLLIVSAAVLASACTGAPQHRAAVQDDSMERVTVGTVQKEIRLGMSAADVAAVLGSPNIVSTDTDRNEAWIYDKFATDVVYSRSRGGVLGLIIGGGTDISATGIGASSYEAGAESSSQRTLTVVIKFDADQRVRDFAYHTARF